MIGEWGLKTGKSENRLRQKLDLLHREDLRFNPRPAGPLDFPQPAGGGGGGV